MKQYQAKHIILIIILTLIWIPLLQKTFTIFKEPKLKGHFTVTSKPNSSTQNWYSGKYQLHYEKYFNSSFGFRSFFVRVNNQIDYTFFNISHANKVIVGKNDMLYEKDHIRSYLGELNIGNEKIIQNIENLKKIRNYLQSKNKDLFVIFAPGKASFFPEFFPKPYDKKIKSISNYDIFRKLLIKENFNFIDFNSLFKQMKDTSKYPLFTRSGIHWSNYGMTLAYDSTLKYIEKTKNISLPKLKIEKIEISTKPKDSDRDIAEAMNLLFNYYDQELAYPKVVFETNSKTVKPKVVVIADSFYWNFYNAFGESVFSENKFWYYLKTEYQKSKKNRNIKNIDINNEINNCDYLILLSTELNLYKFPFGLYEKYNTFEEFDIIKMVSKIRNTPKWFEIVKKQAVEQNKTLEQKLRENAIYTLKN